MRVRLVDLSHDRTAIVETTINNLEEAIRLAGLDLIGFEVLEAYMDRFPSAWHKSPARFDDVDDAWWLKTGQERAPQKVREAYTDGFEYGGTPDLAFICEIHDEAERLAEHLREHGALD